MVSSELMALNARADAGQVWPEIHFYDRAATALTRLLNVDARLRFSPLDERRYLCANHWLDQRCLDFFTEFPCGLGVECSAGLSTRFHRLSEQHEWPQFSWIDVDSEETIALKSNAMPVIDNYRLIAAPPLPDNILGVSNWDKFTPLMIVVDGLAHHVDIEWITALMRSLLQIKHLGTPIRLFVAFEIAPRWYEKLIDLFRLPIMTRCQLLFSDLGGEITHIKYFGKNIQSRKEMVMGLGLQFE